MKKFTPTQLAYLAKEESDTARRYAAYGLKSFSHDEAKHARYFKDALRRLKK